MTAAALLEYLCSRGVRLWTDEGRLRYLAPSGVLTPALCESLRQHKPEICRLLAGDPPIRRVRRDRPAPQSFSQQRIWALSQLVPGSAVYNIAERIEVSGPLIQDALERSLNEIVRRHEILRTTFLASEDGPVQVIAPDLQVPVPTIGLRAVPIGSHESDAVRLAGEQARMPFDLARGPLIRATRLDLSDDRHWILLTLHHIVADAWSMRILFRELAMLYEAFRMHRPSPLPELPIQYADFAQWQRAMLRGETLERHLTYWKRTLQGPLPLLALHGDRPRPPTQSYRGALEPFQVPRDVWESLKSFSAGEGATVFMTLLAALGVLLRRHSGQHDIIIGTAVGNRARAELEALIGPFVNTLALRLDLSGDPSFHELLARVRRRLLDAYSHQDLPFERLVDELHLTRDLAREPLFQVMLTLHNAPQVMPRSGFRSSHLDTGTAKTDLAWFAAETTDGLTGWLEYGTDLFDRSTIERMLSEFELLLRGIVADASVPISRLPLMDAATREQVVREWNDTAAPYPADASLVDLFDAQVARTPDAVAVVCEGESVSYRELQTRATRLARRLRRLGVGREPVVGLCVERSINLVVGLLGVLKAGAAYVPLDPAHPPARLAAILAEASAHAWVTESRRRARRPPDSGRVVYLDSPDPAGEADGASPLPPVATADQLAYVIYTSGSSGRPKGVAITHRGAVNFVNALQQRLVLRSTDVVLAVTPVSFDIAVLELYLPLIVGATMVMAGRSATGDGRELQQLLHRHQVTVLQATPTTWWLLLEAGWRGAPLRQLLCGGEALPRALADELVATGRPLWNLYGPTETTVWSTTGQVLPGPGPVTIGTPVANTQVYVVDRHLQPVPIGVPGELYIGGLGLARGYLAQPALTAETFLPDPFASTAGARWYRTGDLTRWRADGQLEYLGRIDQQVKVRGYRIEPGEIESVLAQHPAVRRSLVTVDRDVDGHERLVAYVVCTGRKRPGSAALKRFLRKRLPDYMVPRVFVALDALPLTPNGKVDRNALPRPGSVDRDSRKAFVEPRTDVERQLAATWAEVLKVKQIGVHDNFFELGGDSILAVLAAAKASRLGLQLSASLVFQHQTIADLTAAADRDVRDDDPGACTGLDALETLRSAGDVPVDVEDCYFLSPLQQGMLFHTLAEPGSGVYVHQVTGRIEGSLDTDAFGRAWQRVLDQHAALRTCFAWDRLLRPVQIVKAGVRLSIERHDWGDAPAAERERRLDALLAADRARGFDVATAPLMRVSLIDAGEGRARFIWTHHHLVVDGWSVPLVLRDVLTGYRAYRRGEPVVLPAPRPYRDYIDWLQRQDVAAAEAFWRGIFGGFRPGPSLAGPGGDVTSGEGATAYETVEARLSEHSTAALRSLARQHRLTPATFVQGAWAIVLSRHLGTRDVVFGVVVSGRPAALPDVASMVGMFVNALPMRIEVTPDTRLLPWLSDLQTRQAQVRRYEYTPLAQIRRWIGVPAGTPLFESNLAFDNYPVDALSRAREGTGLRVHEVRRTLERSNDALGIIAVLERRLSLRIAHDRRRVTTDPATRMVVQFAEVIERMVADPAVALGDLERLIPGERALQPPPTVVAERGESFSF